MGNGWLTPGRFLFGCLFGSPLQQPYRTLWHGGWQGKGRVANRASVPRYGFTDPLRNASTSLFPVADSRPAAAIVEDSANGAARSGRYYCSQKRFEIGGMSALYGEVGTVELGCVLVRQREIRFELVHAF